MSHWWRAYDEAVDDPKLCLLSDRAHRAWFNLCCVTSAAGGTLPAMKVLALKLRMPPAKVTAILDELKEAGLIEEDEAGSRPHNWGGRQFKTDVTDPTNAERQKRYRNGRRTVTPTVTPTVTDGVTDKRPETEAENRKKEESKIAADAASPPGNGKYAFEHGIIRLTAKDFSKWEKAFSYLDLRAELMALAQWAAEQGPDNWFFAVSGALAKRNRDQKFRLEQAKQGGPPRLLTPAGNPWPEGIT